MVSRRAGLGPRLEGKRNSFLLFKCVLDRSLSDPKSRVVQSSVNDCVCYSLFILNMKGGYTAMNREQTKQNKTFVTNMKALISALPQNSVNIFVLAVQLIKVYLQRIHSTKIGSAIVNIFQLVNSAQARYLFLTNASSSSNLFLAPTGAQGVKKIDILIFFHICENVQLLNVDIYKGLTLRNT